MSAQSKIITAAFLVIGDEILSGRTHDKNIAQLAQFLTAHGIELREVRCVRDDESAIIEAVNALRRANTYLFTSGGIGPTHDDITAPSIAKAFELPCISSPEATEILQKYYDGKNLEFTPARRRMTRTPKGASLIENTITHAPGFIIENTHVMAGVPRIFKAMLETLSPQLKTGVKIHSKSIDCPHGEGLIGEALGKIQLQHQAVSIGSYPKFEKGNHSLQLVVRGTKIDDIDAALDAIQKMFKTFDGE